MENVRQPRSPRGSVAGRGPLGGPGGPAWGHLPGDSHGDNDKHTKLEPPLHGANMIDTRGNTHRRREARLLIGAHQISQQLELELEPLRSA